MADVYRAVARPFGRGFAAAARADGAAFAAGRACAGGGAAVFAPRAAAFAAFGSTFAGGATGLTGLAPFTFRVIAGDARTCAGIGTGLPRIFSATRSTSVKWLGPSLIRRVWL